VALYMDFEVYLRLFRGYIFLILSFGSRGFHGE